PAREDEIVVALEVAPEPKMQWQNPVGIHVEKAIDDQDQTLTQSMAAANPNDGLPNGLVMPAVALPVRPPFMMGGRQPVYLHLKKADKPSKKVKELSGTIAAQVRTAPETLISVANVLKAGGQTIKGARGGEIKVIEATKDENGSYKLHIQFQPTPD